VAFDGTKLVGYCVQVTACDLYAQDCADPAQGCYPVASGGFGCLDEGSLAVDADCGSIHEKCAPGLVCEPATSLCRTACDHNAADTCTGGLTGTQVPARNFGVCK